MIYKSSFCNHQTNLVNTIRRLFSDQLILKRLLIISELYAAEDRIVVTRKLLDSPTDLANELKFYYDENKVNQFQKLFEDNLLIFLSLINNIKADNKEMINLDEKALYKNLDKLSGFLESINHFWLKQEWQKLCYNYYELIIKAIFKRLAGNYAEEYELYDKIEEENMKIADLMAQGVISQFNI